MEEVTFQTRQSVQPIYCIGGYKVPDATWDYIDNKGHTHYWDCDKLPTLDYHEAEEDEVWDEYYGNCEYYGDYYPITIAPAYYTCKFCGEEVIPKYINENGPLLQYGECEYLINDKHVTEEEYKSRWQKEIGK